MRMFWPNNKFEDTLKNIQLINLNTPFQEDILLFIQNLSKRLLKLKNKPECVALGFWLRKSNIIKLKEQFDKMTTTSFIKPRGLVFHIAPSNVDTIFVYSWILSMLVGNSNIIRISSKIEINEMLAVIIDEIEKNQTVADRTIICTYDHSEDITSIISSICDSRVIWGGDQTIKTIRDIPLSPLANELAFSDRFSIALLKSSSVQRLDNTGLDSLVDKFYNDVFWFDQMACSSPRLVIWEGEPYLNFWRKLNDKIVEKQYNFLPATQVEKLTTSMQIAINQEVMKYEETEYYSKIKLNGISKELRELHCGGGLFYEISVLHINQIANFINKKDQTISYYGFEKEELIQLVSQINNRGVDRIVPIGEALDFHYIWDGQNFMNSLTRQVIIK